MELINDDTRRTVKGYGSVEIYDRQGELIPISEIKKFMNIYKNRGGPINYNHSNQPVGKMVDWEIVEKNGHSALELKAEIFKDYQSDDDIWSKVKNETITGFSIGGGKPRREVTSKGSILYDTPVWEFSLVERPANSDSTLTAMSIAKSDNQEVAFLGLKKEDVIENTKKADYDKDQLLEGFKVEMEHWETLEQDPNKVLETVLTHLKEKSDYYTKLKEIEKNVDEVNKMAEDVKKSVEDRLSNLENSIDEIKKSLDTKKQEDKEKPKDEEKDKEEDKEKEKEKPKEETEDEKKKKKEQEMEDMKKAVIDAVKKDLESAKVVTKALDIPATTANNDKLTEVKKKLGF